MKKVSYLLALTLMVCTICACGGEKKVSENNVGTETVDNFSTEMTIEDSTDVTIVEAE